MVQSLNNTKRTEVLNMYEKNGQPFLATTRGLQSTRSIQFDVLDLGAGGAVGYLVARRGQSIKFFDYGQNDSIVLSGNQNHRASEADTSLTRGSRTTVSADLLIEWITMAPRANKLQYQIASPNQFPDFVAGVIPANDPMLAAFQGQHPISDPFGVVVPADVGASATLESVLFHAIAPFLTCRFEWDNADRTEKMGTVDQFTQGGGASFLHANGNPDVANRFRVPEGFIWAREGQPASEMQVVCTLQDDVVVPYTPVAGPLTGTHTPLVAAWCEIVMRVGGLLVRVPGSN